MAKSGEKLQAAERAQRELEDAHEVAVGALRGLLECAQYGDAEAIAILHKLQSAGDDAMRDALSLVFECAAEYSRAQAALTREVERTLRGGALPYGTTEKA